jgi:hypothetical protein
MLKEDIWKRERCKENKLDRQMRKKLFWISAAMVEHFLADERKPHSRDCGVLKT